MFFTLVRHNNIKIIERFNKFQRIAEPGLHFMIPFVDNVSHSFSLKDTLINLKNQSAIT